ncbi:hypothetical protein Trydic_g6184 [Trypoxylus dichotomus]
MLNRGVATKLAGREWFSLPLKNDLKIAKRSAAIMNPPHVQKSNCHIVSNHFTKVEELLEGTGLKNNASKIYNMVEKGCRLTLHYQQTALATKGAKRVLLICREHVENAMHCQMRSRYRICYSTCNSF